MRYSSDGHPLQTANTARGNLIASKLPFQLIPTEQFSLISKERLAEYHKDRKTAVWDKYGDNELRGAAVTCPRVLKITTKLRDSANTNENDLNLVSNEAQ